MNNLRLAISLAATASFACLRFGFGISLKFPETSPAECKKQPSYKDVKKMNNRYSARHITELHMGPNIIYAMSHVTF